MLGRWVMMVLMMGRWVHCPVQGTALLLAVHHDDHGLAHGAIRSGMDLLLDLLRQHSFAEPSDEGRQRRHATRGALPAEERKGHMRHRHRAQALLVPFLASMASLLIGASAAKGRQAQSREGRCRFRAVLRLLLLAQKRAKLREGKREVIKLWEVVQQP